MGNKFSSRQSIVQKSNTSDTYLSVLFKDCCENGSFEIRLFESLLLDNCPVDNFPSQLAGKLFPSDVAVTQKSFEAILQDLLDCAYKTQEYQLHFFTDIFTNEKDVLQRIDIHNIILACLRFATSTASNCEKEQSPQKNLLINSMVDTCMDSEEEVSTIHVVKWFMEHQLPIYAGLNGWLHEKLGKTKHMSIFHMLPYPQHHSEQLLTQSLLWYFCLILPPCYIRIEKEHHHDADDEKDVEDGSNELTWQLLYNSDDHGLSLNRLKNKCFSYKSPTISLIKMNSGALIALALDAHWIDSPENFGGSYCQLIEIHPKFQILESGAKLVYLKEHGRSIAKGLHLGCGKPAKIEINSDLDEVCMVYKHHTADHVIMMEVWGCGGAKATAEQKNQKQWEAKETEKRKKVKNPGDWQDNPDRSILEMGGVRINHSERHDP